MEFFKNYRYKNLTFLTLSIVVTIIVFRFEPFHEFLLHLGKLGYLGAFIAGVLFVSTFTVAIGSVILLILAENFSVIEIAVIAGLGAVAGDLTIFKFIRNKSLVDEIMALYKYFGGHKIRHLIHTKYFGWMLPVIGALIIASPLPDELGVGLMGISKMKLHEFVILSFVLNSIGIFLVLFLSGFVKP